jgi:tetratricopeptide (TPR) repeat protein
MHCGNHAAANAQLEELLLLVEEKGALFWKGPVMLYLATSLVLLGKFADAVEMFDSWINPLRSTGATLAVPYFLSSLARAYVELGQFDKAWGCIEEAISMVETTKETWYGAEINRVAGEIALLSPTPDAAKAKMYFERSLEIAREQPALRPCARRAPPGSGRERRKTGPRRRSAARGRWPRLADYVCS